MKKTLIQWFGLSGIVSLLSYIAGMIFVPSAYPGYDWMSRPVIHLYERDAPSFALWNQVAALYAIGGLVCVSMLAVAIQGKWNKPIRYGIYLLAATLWISSIGNLVLRFSGAEGAIAFPDAAVVILNAIVIPSVIISIILVMVGGYRQKRFVSLARGATIILVLMMISMISMVFVPAEYAGIPERAVLISAMGFPVLLGLFLFMGKLDDDKH